MDRSPISGRLARLWARVTGFRSSASPWRALQVVFVLVVVVVIAAQPTPAPVKGVNQTPIQSISVESPGQGMSAATQVSAFVQEETIKQEGFEKDLEQADNKEKVIKQRIQEIEIKDQIFTEIGRASANSADDPNGTVSQQGSDASTSSNGTLLQSDPVVRTTTVTQMEQSQIADTALAQTIIEATEETDPKTVENATSGTDIENTVTADESRNELFFTMPSRNHGFFSKSRNHGFFSKSRNHGFFSKSRNHGFFSKSRNHGFFSESRNHGFFKLNGEGKVEDVYRTNQPIQALESGDDGELVVATRRQESDSDLTVRTGNESIENATNAGPTSSNQSNGSAETLVSSLDRSSNESIDLETTVVATISDARGKIHLERGGNEIFISAATDEGTKQYYGSVNTENGAFSGLDPEKYQGQTPAQALGFACDDLTTQEWDRAKQQFAGAIAAKFSVTKKKVKNADKDSVCGALAASGGGHGGGGTVPIGDGGFSGGGSRTG